MEDKSIKGLHIRYEDIKEIEWQSEVVDGWFLKEFSLLYLYILQLVLPTVEVRIVLTQKWAVIQFC